MRIACDWLRSWVIATGRRNTFSGLGSFSCRPTVCRCWWWARQTEVSRPAVWRWQQRFAEQGVDGLLRDKTRKPGKKPLPAATVAQILALPCGKPPRQATHWTGRMVAKAAGVSLRAVQRIWQANRLQPHRVRTFKTSNDPAFAEKVEDVVGLYINPPVHAVVMSIDEKSQIQALDSTQPGLPMKPG
jgi:hypothetical protein